MRSGPAAILAGGFLALSAGAAGFFLGRASAPMRATGEDPEPAHGSEPDFAPVIAELQRSKQEVLDALGLARSSDPPSAARQPASGSEQPAGIDERLDRIAVTVEGIAKRMDEELHLMGRGRGFPNIDAIHGRYRIVELGLESHGTLKSLLTDAHARWTHRDLLDRYGPPFSDAWSQASGVTTYDLGPAWLSFNTAKDAVIDIGIVAKQ